MEPLRVWQQSFTILLRGNVSLSDRIAQAVRFDRVRVEGVNKESFLITEIRKGEDELVLLGFNHDLTTDQILAEMEQLNLKPATAELAFDFVDSCFPNANFVFPVAFLGTAYCHSDSERFCVAVWTGSIFRTHPSPPNNEWIKEWCFAAIRK